MLKYCILPLLLAATIIQADATQDLRSTAYDCNLDAVKKAIARKGKINAQSNRHNRITPLMGASGQVCTDVVKYLILKKAHVNAKDKNGVTALMRAMGTIEAGECDQNVRRTEVMDLLIKAGADVNAKDKSGNSVMMYATGQVYPYKGYQGFVEILEAAGAEQSEK